MASTYTNLISPADSALKNKMNPRPLASPSSFAPANPANPFATAKSTPALNPVTKTAAPTAPVAKSAQQAQPKAVAAPKSSPVTIHIGQPSPSPLLSTPQPSSTGLIPSPFSQPITGNTQTPSGATVNATTGGLISLPGQGTSFPGLLNSLANQQNSPYNQQASESVNRLQDVSGANPATSGPAFDAYGRAVDNLKNFDRRLAQQYAANESNPIPLEFQQGRAQVIARQAASEREALQQAVNQQQSAISQQIQGTQTQQSGFNQAGSLALTGQGQSQSALGTAADFAQPQLAGYNQQAFNPITQQFGGGQGGVNDVVNSVAEKVRSGQMTYNDAISALSGYGQGGVNALLQALPQGFNVAQSNTLAGQQGSITPALNYATLALNHAKETLGQLAIPGQTSNIGALSDVSNWFSNISGIGKEATRTKEGALAEARSAIQAVLASVKGGNPTEYRDQSYAILPNNATPADIDAAMSNLQTLGSGKQSIYSNPGSNQGSNGSLYEF